MMLASIREIKRRRVTIENTSQITRAMKLVSTVKLQKTKDNARKIQPYFDKMYATIRSILSRTQGETHPFLTGGRSDNRAVIVISSNRGLAGGYNYNVVHQVIGMPVLPENVLLYTVGSKGREMLRAYGYAIEEDFSDVMDAPSYEAAKMIGRTVLQSFSEGKAGAVELVYTAFKNTLVQEARRIRLLPVTAQEVANEPATDGLLMNYEPDAGQVLERVIPQYIYGMIYGALMDAAAAENGARMTAMDQASENAEEMIGRLTQSYNRARQGAITQEITEIVSGSEALS